MIVPILLMAFGYIRSRRSLAFGWLIGLIFYVCYAMARDVWANPALILISIFIAVNVPQYSRLSSRIEEYLQSVSAAVTPGRLGRFAFQMAFNAGVYALFLAGGVVAPAGIEALGGVLGAAAMTTLASQGFQYAGQTMARFGYGQPEWNILVGLSANVFLAAMALAGYPGARIVFVVSAIVFGALVFSVGLASDIRAAFWPTGGIAVFFGTFNPFHISHLQLVRRALDERKVEKVVIHPTIVPKLHAEAIERGEIRVAAVENGLQVYERTAKADPYVNYFPTGDRFYCAEDRRKMIELAVGDAGLSGQVEVAFMPEIYRDAGFRGVFREIARRHRGKRIHGIHGGDIGGMMIRTVMDESGWYYPLSARRKDNVSATAIRAGATGMTTPSVTKAIADMTSAFRSLATTPVDETEGIAPAAAKLPGNGASEISVRVARTLDEIVQAYVIRGLVFIGEQDCPYGEEFDGNDGVATHLVAYHDGEPAGTMRLRWFAGFAKLEHAAVRREHRRAGILRHLTDTAVGIASRKGYRHMYATSQVDRLPIWEKLGFRPVDKPQFAFSDYQYIPIERVLEAAASPILLTSPDLLIIRPEGDWDRPGVLDRSGERVALA